MLDPNTTGKKQKNIERYSGVIRWQESLTLLSTLKTNLVGH